MAPQVQKPEEGTDDSLQTQVTLASDNFKFEENEVMTSYEGYWVRKTRVRFINGMYHKFHRKAAANKELASDEQKQGKLDRCMKKLLRNEHRMLKIELAKNKNKSIGKGNPKNDIKQPTTKNNVPKRFKHWSEMPKPNGEDDAIENSFSSYEMPRMPKKKKPGKYLGINYKADPDIVNYEGFYIYAKATKRLNKIKKKMTKKGMSAEDIRKEIRKECRKEERLCKRGKKKQENSCN